MADKVKKTLYPSPTGDKTRAKYRWNADKTRLVKVGEIDIQKDINERAKGMTIGEQLARLAHGDLSVLRNEEPVYADVSNNPEHPSEVAQAVNDAVIAEAQRITAEKEAALKQAEQKKTDLELAKEALAAAQAKYDALNKGSEVK